jgi:hypothetical protein
MLIDLATDNEVEDGPDKSPARGHFYTFHVIPQVDCCGPQIPLDFEMIDIFEEICQS